MSKNIVFCADGTWNSSSTDDNPDDVKAWTNVYKLFLNLDGTLSADTLRVADEQEKTLSKEGAVVQVAKYIHGVGDSRNPIVKLMGGAFGAGVISRIVRGYTFISRNYEADDKIYITGFSRGAYTARALAGLIASQGLLAKPLTTDKETAYRRGAQVWYRYRKAVTHRDSSLARLAEVMADFPAFISRETLKDSDLVSVGSLACVAVWDTVGAMGFPQFDQEHQSVDAFKFADMKLNLKVALGLHAIALDERRGIFSPTLWDDAQNVVQMLFAGAHADVGGGYPHGAESGLSDGALQWVTERLRAEGLHLSSQPEYRVAPNPLGTAHQPWRHAPFNVPGVSVAPRHFPVTLPEHPSVQQRRNGGRVVPEPGDTACSYPPI